MVFFGVGLCVKIYVIILHNLVVIMIIALPAYKTSPAAILLNFSKDGELSFCPMNLHQLKSYAFGKVFSQRYSPIGFPRRLTNKEPCVLLRGGSVALADNLFTHQQHELLRDLGAFVTLYTRTPPEVNNQDPSLIETGFFRGKASYMPPVYDNKNLIMPVEYGHTTCPAARYG